MKNIKYIVSIALIIAITLITYIYFNKEPVESVPRRATFVYLQEGFFNEVLL